MGLLDRGILSGTQWIRDQRRQLRKRYSNYRLGLEDKGAPVARKGNDRTAYIIGLFGSGRWYLNDLILDHIGPRAKYFRDSIRLHSGPTSIIYSGHATLKYPSRHQAVPAETAQIVQAARARNADLIFIYRHPLDSLLTNWLWWRTWKREGRWIEGVTQVYAEVSAFSRELEADFDDFEAFAAGDPAYLAPSPGMRFLSFAEFAEETHLYVQCATLALRFEDFMIDPRREFSRVAETMSVRLDTSRLRVDRPQTSPYRFRAVREGSPRFAAFIDNLRDGTKDRIAALSYPLT